MTNIVNMPITDAIVPSSLKNASFSPRIKKANLNHEEFTSFRPISNLTLTSKCIEKVVATQICHHIEDITLMKFCRVACTRGWLHLCQILVTHLRLRESHTSRDLGTTLLIPPLISLAKYSLVASQAREKCCSFNSGDFFLRFFHLLRRQFKGGYTCDFHRALATRQNLKKSHHHREQKFVRVAAALQ